MHRGNLGCKQEIVKKITKKIDKLTEQVSVSLKENFEIGHKKNMNLNLHYLNIFNRIHLCLVTLYKKIHHLNESNE